MADGTKRYFLALGRIQDVVDPAGITALVLERSQVYDLQGRAVGAELCEMLREAADSGEAPYFFEALLSVTRERISFGKHYSRWRKRMRKEMTKGNHIAYCGGPQRSP